MCGRTACTLAPDDVCRACGHKDKQGKWRQPRWQEPPGGQKYYSSYNVAPGSHTPVLVSKKHFKTSTEITEAMETETGKLLEGNESETGCEWVVQPMQWGLVPFWHSGDPKSVGYSMTNARSDGILRKRSFKGPLEKGRRCVVLVDGYFEWQKTEDGKKQPYFIYFPHAASDTVEELNKAQQDTEVEADRVYTGRRLLTLAGIFDVWKPKDGGAPLYSYSVITVDAHKNINWIHERMPAVLDGEEAVRNWLDFGSVPLLKAMELIEPTSSVHYHPVSSTVNNAKNKLEECVKPVDLEKEKKKQDGSSSLMAAWLSKGKKRTSDASEKSTDNEHKENDKKSSSPTKKQKTEDNS